MRIVKNKHWRVYWWISTSDGSQIYSTWKGKQVETVIKRYHRRYIIHYHDYTVSLFSYAPLIKYRITRKRNMLFFSKTTSLKRIYICFSHWNFIVIRWETSEKMDLKGHYHQNTISHFNTCISNETQITLYFFQFWISEWPEIRADLFLAISKTGMCLLT